MTRPEGDAAAIGVDYETTILRSTGGWRPNRLLRTQQFSNAVAELVTARYAVMETSDFLDMLSGC